MFCKLGKDRTGLLCALLLSCCGASDVEIITDYARSTCFCTVPPDLCMLVLPASLRGSWRCRSTDIPSLAKDPVVKSLQGFDVSVFSSAPPHVMAGTLQHLRQQYGGVPSYLESACGFPRAEQALLAQHLRPV